MSTLSLEGGGTSIVQRLVGLGFDRGHVLTAIEAVRDEALPDGGVTDTRVVNHVLAAASDEEHMPPGWFAKGGRVVVPRSWRLAFTEFPVTGDGDCLWRAVAQRFGGDAVLMRRRVCTFMLTAVQKAQEKPPDQLEGPEIFALQATAATACPSAWKCACGKRTGLERVKVHFETMMEPGRHGDERELIALSCALGVRVCEAVVDVPAGTTRTEARARVRYHGPSDSRETLWLKFTYRVDGAGHVCGHGAVELASSSYCTCAHAHARVHMRSQRLLPGMTVCVPASNDRHALSASA